MYTGRFVFAQVIDLLPRRIFHRIVKEHDGDKWVKHFTCWHQMSCMIFGQLSGRESLSDLVVCMDAHSDKTYHLGMGNGPKKSNLAKVNEGRDYRIFKAFADHLMGLVNDAESREMRVYAFDSSTIDLCLSVFWWADFRKTKAGIKAHVLYDVNLQIPTCVFITNARTHDVRAMDFLVYEVGAYYIFDRAYVDFRRLFKLHNAFAYFVTRAKKNMKFKVITSAKVDLAIGIREDQVIRTTGTKSATAYAIPMRRVVFYDEEKDKLLVFLTNNMKLSAHEVAQLYKKRWGVELFFKWIKQHLKVKKFWGQSENAVRVQIYSAVITYCLVHMLKEKQKIPKTTYEILQILSVSLFDKTPVNELLTKCKQSSKEEENCKQLEINYI